VLFVLIVVGWFALVAVFVALCRIAAGSDDPPAGPRDERARAGASERFAAHSREGSAGARVSPPYARPRCDWREDTPPVSSRHLLQRVRCLGR
jgi:hypothetical protein